MRVSPYVLTLLTIIITTCFTISARAQCGAGKVTMPVIYSFGSDEYKVAEVYNSLQPKLRMLSPQPLTPSTFKIENGALELQFCLNAKDVPQEGETFSMNFGPREMRLTVRPVNAQTQRMAAIRIVDQPDPDWVILRYAKLVLDKDLHPILEIGARNLGGATHSGFEIELDLRQRILCVGGGRTSGEIPVDFQFQAGRGGRGTVIVWSRDPQFSRAVRRDGSYVLTCGEVSYLQAVLGATGPMSASEDLTLQYTFNEKYSKDKKRPLRNISKPAVTDFLHFEGKKLIAKGERVFPSELNIEDDMR